MKVISKENALTATLIDGRALAASVKTNLTHRVEKLVKMGHRPGLAVVLVGENPASLVYVRNKMRTCTEVGIENIEVRFAADTSEATVLDKIEELNQDERVDGILVQLPLPDHINPTRIIEAIDADKDVDGFHELNAGRLMTGVTGFRPCTPYGVMKMLEAIDCDLTGKNAVVVGRSNIVGKPLALMLLEKNATVTICHSKTKNLKEVCAAADILVAAVGREGFVTGDMVKPGAVVIDVGINRGADGKLCGDVDTESVKAVAGWITPVPGGVGPMTIAMLMTNTVEAVERRLASL